MNKEHVSMLAQLAEKGETADVITIVNSPTDKSCDNGKMLIMTAGNAFGRLIDKSFTKLVIEKVSSTEWKKPTLFEIVYSSCQYRLFWNKLTRRRSALVLGGGHISQPLTELLTKLGYAVTVVDDRPDFANVARFPQAEQVMCQKFDRALESLALSGFGAIVIVTRGHRSDMECLRAVIDQPAAYIGMIGSQGRVRGVVNALKTEGFNRAALSRLRAPIGLDIGAEIPVEIALSIAAEIIAVGRNASCIPLSDNMRYKHD